MASHFKSSCSLLHSPHQLVQTLLSASHRPAVKHAAEETVMTKRSVPLISLSLGTVSPGSPVGGTVRPLVEELASEPGGRKEHMFFEYCF